MRRPPVSEGLVISAIFVALPAFLLCFKKTRRAHSRRVFGPHGEREQGPTLALGELTSPSEGGPNRLRIIRRSVSERPAGVYPGESAGVSGSYELHRQAESFNLVVELACSLSGLFQ